ncbi:MAG: excinuclease ABC subunit A, partial [Ilumatobacteraceae bacterium]
MAPRSSTTAKKAAAKSSGAKSGAKRAPVKKSAPKKAPAKKSAATKASVSTRTASAAEGSGSRALDGPPVISVRGAREHNLRNVSVEIPRDQLVVLTGLSGSGKSSLAFDTIYAEGPRRYVESLS